MSGWIDPIDMKVRRILAGAFAKAHRPHLTVDPPECERCHGNGNITERSAAKAGEVRYVIDDLVICPDCLGSGIDE